MKAIVPYIVAVATAATGAHKAENLVRPVDEVHAVGVTAITSRLLQDVEVEETSVQGYLNNLIEASLADEGQVRRLARGTC